VRPYEVVLILEASAEDSVVDGVINRVKEYVVGKGGKVGEVQKWGRRRFAYELKHRLEGYYSLVEVTLEPEAVSDLDRMLTLSDDVVRHKIVRISDVVAGRSRPALNIDTAEEAAESIGA